MALVKYIVRVCSANAKTVEVSQAATPKIARVCSANAKQVTVSQP